MFKDLPYDTSIKLIVTLQSSHFRSLFLSGSNSFYINNIFYILQFPKKTDVGFTHHGCSDVGFLSTWNLPSNGYRDPADIHRRESLDLASINIILWNARRHFDRV